jgi:GT2 family glycosyltransferase
VNVTTTARVGVVIAAHNRAALVERAVRSIYTQTLEPQAIELCLVNSASSDNTGTRLAELRQEAPEGMRVEVIDDDIGGAARARNKGWRELQAPIVAFLDDDAEAQPDWLTRALERFEEAPQTGVVAGKTEVAWLAEPPEGALAETVSEYVGLDYGQRARQIRYPRAPIGPNMLVRREALTAVGGFDLALGPGPSQALVGEEGDLSLRIEKCRWQVEYAPEVQVQHLVDPARVTTDYLLTRARIHGRSRFLVDWKHFGSRRAPHQMARLLRGVWRVIRRRRFTVRERVDFVYGWAYFEALLEQIRSRGFQPRSGK